MNLAKVTSLSVGSTQQRICANLINKNQHNHPGKEPTSSAQKSIERKKKQQQNRQNHVKPTRFVSVGLGSETHGLRFPQCV